VTASQPRHRTPAPPAPPPGVWRYRAACSGTDLDLFFPGRGESAEPARRVCAGCPVREPCLDYALSHGITHGIWGGLAERDRRALRSRHVGATRRERDAAIAAAAAAGYRQTAIGRAFGLTRTSVNRVLSGTNSGDGHEPRPDPHLPGSRLAQRKR
jgi:WhiB family transcriptional regulator, redox-sensing transcriptional regulator